MSLTLPAQMSAEMKKQGYKPRVSITIGSMSQYISATETFTTDAQTYTGTVKGSPTIRVAIDSLGGMTKVTSFNVTFLNQELFSDIFNTYPTPENSEIVVKLYFDDGTAILEAESLQLFKGKIKDFPAITYDSVSFSVETNNLLVDRMLGDLVEDFDVPLASVPEDSLGKVKPIAYGNHSGMRSYFKETGSVGALTLTQAHSIWPCLWGGEYTSLGSNHWIVANHTIQTPNLPTTVGGYNFWAVDSDLENRFVRIDDAGINAVTAIAPRTHVGIRIDADVYYYDFVISSDVSDTSASQGSTGSTNGHASVSDDDNAIERDIDTSASFIAEGDERDYSENGVTNSAELTFNFPQSYAIADEDIYEVKVYAVVQTNSTGDFTTWEVNGTDVSTPQNLNISTIKDCGTDASTQAGVTAPVEATLSSPIASGVQGGDATSKCVFVWKRVKYRKTHVIGEDSSNDPIIVPKRLPVYCAGSGMEYGDWVDGRSNGSEGSVIIRGAGIIESILRDHLGLGDDNIRESDFDDAHSATSATNISLYIDKQVKARDLIDKVAKRVKSAVFFDYDNRVSMKVFPSSTANFAVSGTGTAGSDDIFTFTPTVSSGSFTNHPIIRNSFSLKKMQDNLANTVTVNYAKFHTGDYAKTSTATDTTYISDDTYKATLGHDYTSDETTAEVYRDFQLARRSRKQWACVFTTFLNGVMLEINDVINIRHPVLDGIFGSSTMNSKKWVVYSISMALGAYEIRVEAVELTTS